MKFPWYTKNLKPEELVKVVSSNGSVTVSNESAYEYAYNQYLEGAKRISVITPDGKKFPVRFRAPNPTNLNTLPFHNPKEDAPPRGRYEINEMARKHLTPKGD